MKRERFEKIKERFKKYVEAKAALDARISDSRSWFKAQYGGRYTGNEGEKPTTAFIFNAIANKHSDAVVAYPDLSIAEREKNDRKEAEKLEKVVPFILDNTNFKKCYSRVWWNKLVEGTGVYGVFWDNSLNNGLGDISVNKLSLKDLYFDMNVDDIQDSEYLFVTCIKNINDLHELYPHSKKHSLTNELWSGYDDNKAMVIDCYYKKRNKNGKKVLHLLKFAGDCILDSSENYESTKERGIYDHGLYPIVFDVLYPEDGSPIGFGLVDIARNPQMYIDKLDNILSKNAFISGKTRWVIKDNGGINEKELLDLSCDVIHMAGSISDDNIKQLETAPASSSITEHRNKKIEELKEVIGNREFYQGGISGGVSSYGAIVALQEASSKIVKDMIFEGYEAYKSIIYMIIELVRQFYDTDRYFRITGEDSSIAYMSYNNEKIRLYDDSEERLRKPIFDVIIKTKNNNQVVATMQNEFIADLYKNGFFNKERVKESLAALEIMEFDGKEVIKRYLLDNDSEISHI